MKRNGEHKRVTALAQRRGLSRLLKTNWTKRTAGMIKRSRFSSEALLSAYEAHFDRLEPAR